MRSLLLLMLPGVVWAQPTLLGLGNSQLDYCDGSLSRITALSAETAAPMVALQQRGSARLIAHAARAAVLGRIADEAADFVLIAHQLTGFDDAPFEANLAAAITLHEATVRAGGETLLFMTYATGTGRGGPQEEAVDRYLADWQRLEAALDAHPIDGATHDVTLVPVMLLWEAGKARVPSQRLPDAELPTRCAEAGWMTDSLHGANPAQYATAVLIHAFATCADPLAFPDDPTVDAEVAAWARAWAADALAGPHRPARCAPRPPADAGLVDAAVDAEVEDAAVADAEVEDAAVADAEPEDAGGVDAEVGDAAVADRGPLLDQAVDASPEPTGPDVGFTSATPEGCRSAPAGPGVLSLWLLVGLAQRKKG